MSFINEILIACSIPVFFGFLIFLVRVFGKTGIYAWLVLEAIAANIEVLILVNAFGMEQTLGNVLFASSFLATDILSEIYGKKEASKAVWVGITSLIIFVVISVSWQFFTVSENDFCSKSIREVFAVTPRIMAASLLGYLVSELYDVWVYHKIWEKSTKSTGDKSRYLWLRNNGSTLSSQLINTLIFTFLAFAGTYDFKTLISIAISSYVIYVFTSLFDTPFIYLARKLAPKVRD